MANTILRKHTPECHVCPIQCARYVEIEEGPYMKGSGPEYETLGSLVPWSLMTTWNLLLI